MAEIKISKAPVEYQNYKIDNEAKAEIAAESFCIEEKNSLEDCQEFLAYLENSGYALIGTNKTWGTIEKRIEIYLVELKSKKRKVRANAVEKLADFAQYDISRELREDIVRGIFEVSGDKRAIVRFRAVKALKSLLWSSISQELQKEIIDLLIVTLKDEEGEIRAAVIDALGGFLTTEKGMLKLESLSISYNEIAILVIMSLGDRNEDVSFRAASVVGRFAEKVDEEMIDPLINDLESLEVDIRRNAVRAAAYLAMIQGISPKVIGKLVDPLIKISEDEYENGYIKEVAVTALGDIAVLGIAQEKITNCLLVALGDSESAVKRSAVISLGKIAETGYSQEMIVEHLIAKLNDANYYVIKEARKTLERLKASQNVPHKIRKKIKKALDKADKPYSGFTGCGCAIVS